MVYEYHQDDPKKCTAARLAHLRLVQRLHNVKQIPRQAIVLNPTSEKTLAPPDKELADEYGIVALDCSWNRSDQVFNHSIQGENRRLPTLLAGNPTNYGVAGKLSTAEALYATLYILGYASQATNILQSFSWGPTFYTLNNELLDAYATGDAEARQLDEILKHRKTARE